MDKQRLEKPMSVIHSSTEIYKGRQFSIIEEHVTLPHKVKAKMAYVRHPGSTVIVPWFDDDTIGLIYQYRHVINAYIYEVPAGTMDYGERPIECASRELEEETGMSASQLIQLGSTYLLPAYSDEISYIFLARNMQVSVQNLDEDEIISFKKFKISDVLEMIETGAMTDALSILAILRAKRYMQTKGGVHE